MKNQAVDLLRQVKSSHRPSVLTKEAILLLELAAQGEADLDKGRVLPQEDALARVRAHLRQR